MILRTLCFAFLIFLCSYSSAQDRLRKLDAQTWLQYYNTIFLTNDWNIVSDITLRGNSLFEEKAQFLVRTGIKKNISKNLSFTFGAAKSQKFKNDELASNEFRPYQEVMVKSNTRKLSITNRVRIEERFTKSIDTNVNSYQTRVRYRFQSKLPLFKLKRREINASVAVEPFVSIPKLSSSAINELRLISGLQIPVSSNVSYSISLHRQYSFYKDSTNSYRNILWVGLGHSLGKRTKAKN